MRRWVMLILLGHMAQEYHAQSGFNLRYDLLDSAWSQHPVGIERHPEGYLVFIQTYYEDSDQITPTRALMLINDMGIRIWDRIYPEELTSTYYGWANVADRTGDGGYVIGGTRDTIDRPAFVNLVRFSMDGDTLWTRSWGDDLHEWSGQQVKQTPDKGYIIAGLTDVTGSVDALAIKTDSLGNEEWLETYGGPLWDGFVAVDLLPDSGFYFGGDKNITSNNIDFSVYRVDKNGGVLWHKVWGTGYDEPNAHLCSTSDGNCAVSGAIGHADDFSLTRPYIAKLDSADGSILWEHEYGGMAGSTGFFTVKECTNTDLIAAGSDYSVAYQRGLLLRATTDGDSLWMRTYYYQDTAITEGTGRFWDVIQTDDGGFIACGWALGQAGGNTPPGYSQDTWVVKVDSMGCIVPGCDATGVTEMITNLKDALTVWPNPAREQAQVGIALPPALRGKSTLTLTVVNATGQAVLSTAAREGNNTVPLGALSAGLYHVHLSAGNTWISGTKLMIE